MDFLEAAWEEREETHYKEIFGSIGKGIYPLSFELFLNTFGTEGVDPTWLHYGVFACPPTDKRKSWVYVTSGMSNPWGAEEKEEFSGFGVEFLIETPEEKSWGIQVLQNLMAYNILLSIGHFGEKPMLDYGARVSAAIQPNLTHVVFSAPKDFPEYIELKSGRVDFLQVVGITSEELAYAKENGSYELIELIFSKQNSLVTNSTRSSWIDT